MPRKAAVSVASPPMRSVQDYSLKAAYLAWIGSIHYPTIRSWTNEVATLGVSKRLPNAACGRALLKPGTVVLVAHDEGELIECKACPGLVECPACRKRMTRVARWRDEVDRIVTNFRGDWDTEASGGQKRSMRVRETHVAKLLLECQNCSICKGLNRYQGSTGGFVELRNGRRIDYRTYTYWLHQPAKFKPHDLVRARYMCTDCGGSGHLPIAQVFGMFATERIEWVMAAVSNGKPAARRRAGERTPGHYAVTSPEKSTSVIQGAVEHLVKEKIITSAELYGGFALFTQPVRIDAKRFRGIARFSIERLKRTI